MWWRTVIRRSHGFKLPSLGLSHKGMATAVIELDAGSNASTNA
ncbi:hypothetical protein OH492_11705 [Vibrio chagasii]|nr:hypothetical protein [Vibrio chagasii]